MATKDFIAQSHIFNYVDEYALDCLKILNRNKDYCIDIMLLTIKIKFRPKLSKISTDDRAFHCNYTQIDKIVAVLTHVTTTALLIGGSAYTLRFFH